MAQNVCFLFGINGVGKSTLARSLATSILGAVTINASETMRAAIGTTKREELERMDPKRKHELFHCSLLREFHAHAMTPLIICDTHLVVTIRNEQGCHRELMWDRSFDPFAKSLLYVTAPPETILRRRERDLAQTGRLRPLCPIAIADDHRIDHSAFHLLFSHRPNAHIVENHDLT